MWLPQWMFLDLLRMNLIPPRVELISPQFTMPQLNNGEEDTEEELEYQDDDGHDADDDDDPPTTIVLDPDIPAPTLPPSKRRRITVYAPLKIRKCRIWRCRLTRVSQHAAGRETPPQPSQAEEGAGAERCRSREI